MEPEKSLVQSVEELRDDLKKFIVTRYELLRAEVSQSMTRAKDVALMFGAAAVFGMLALILLSICFSLVIALAFGSFANQVGVIGGFLITGVGSLVLAGTFAAVGKSRLKKEEMTPNRTLHVLQRDLEELKKGGREYGGESIRRRA